MARPRSEFLSSLGKLFAIFKKVVDSILSLGGGDEDVARIGSDENLANEIALLVLGKLQIIRHALSVGGWPVEKIGDKVIAIHVNSEFGPRYELGQQVVSTGRHSEVGLPPKGTRGWIVRLEEPYKLPYTSDVISVIFKGSDFPWQCTPGEIEAPALT